MTRHADLEKIDQTACALLRMAKSVEPEGSAVITRLDAGWLNQACDLFVAILKEKSQAPATDKE